MALPAVAGATLLAADLYPLARPAGGTETGKYFINVASYTSGAVLAQYMSSLSRGQTPVSVTIDTADIAPISCNAPTTSNLTANGFEVLTHSTAIIVAAGCAGNTTIQY